jgi:hypothetical protein
MQSWMASLFTSYESKWRGNNNSGASQPRTNAEMLGEHTVIKGSAGSKHFRCLLLVTDRLRGKAEARPLHMDAD